MAVTYSSTGTKAASQVKLDPEVFGIKDINHKLLNQAYVAYLSNGRLNLAQSKTRGLVRGGGKKPHPQKGTGRARSGSRRNPLWRGGGTIFGPTGYENYTKKLNLKAKRTAIIHALSALNLRDSISVIEDIKLKTPKSSELIKLLVKLNCANKYTLIVVDNVTDELKLASRNLTNVNVTAVKYLNTAKLLDSDAVIFSKAALAGVIDWLSPAQKTSKQV